MIYLRTPLSKAIFGTIFAVFAFGCLRGTFIEQNPTKPLLLLLIFGGLSFALFRSAYLQHKSDRYFKAQRGSR